ncbi:MULTISPECIES: hypothetical protein [Rathayibacter]|uniref:hypothetical protein n=1 Tax=Rathayibacter TaxID=33886 RepID=UPI000F9A34B0|nr:MULTISPECIES: hypothetical protein [Rathayibacter]MCJ1675097.1 hypothetical protein [Rathayibacter sp. VKM Ac-2929]MCJ1681883.1 hypothetical protein [Rathayibacter sp. VKM Ac-2928]MCJ1686174.1 hypothetical protein [Rathayibacter sp. VKM Ac-2927]MCJ1699134.1 hypothetical protein [Rathayibacter festucae]MCJ1705086.1 hypothetical protein [Rathayibacter sp. VKM Ac-2926]
MDGGQSPLRPLAAACADPDPHPRGRTALSIIIRHDPATLREEIDVDAAQDRLEEIGALRSLAALTEKAELLRLLGRLDEAWDIATEAVRRTRFSGDRAELLTARVRRARLMQLRDRSDEALSELTLCVEEARTHEWHVEHSFALKHRGLALFESGEYSQAARDFDAATALGERVGVEEEELEVARLGFAAASEFQDESTRGPRADGAVRGRRRAEGDEA